MAGVSFLIIQSGCAGGRGHSGRELAVVEAGIVDHAVGNFS